MEYGEGKLFIEALIYIASADDIVGEAEKTFLYEFGEKFDFSQADVDTICNEMVEREMVLGDILSKIETEETKISLLNTLIDLCHVDGKYSAIEKEGMAVICNMLGIETKMLKKLEREYQANESKQAFKNGVVRLKAGVALAGEKSAQGGKFVATGIAKGVGMVGSKLSDAMANAKQLRQENKKLREELKKTTITEAVKQKIVLQLNIKISELTSELKREKERNNQNEEMIRILMSQLEDLEKTMEVAESVKTA